MLGTIQRIARERYWRLKVSEEPTPHIIEAAISLSNWEMFFTMSPFATERMEEMGIGGSEQQTMAWGLAHHEINHWGICPFDAEGEYIVVQQVTRVVRHFERNLTDESFEKLVKFLANLVFDIIVDTVASVEDRSGRYADAQLLFFLKELRLDALKSACYKTFIKLNLILWGDQANISDKIPTSLVSGNEKKLLDLVRAVFPDPGNPDCLASWLRNRRNWPKTARSLAGYFITLMPDPTRADWWRPSPMRSVLTTLYEGRAAQVRIQSSSDEGVLQQWPVSPMLIKPVDPVAAPGLEQLSWFHTLCTPDHKGDPKIRLHQVDMSIEHPVVSSDRRGFLPDLAFIIDSSGSMSYDPYNGRGNYDLLLRTIFSVFQWLNTEGLASYLRYAVLNFSSETEYSGWLPWDSRDAIYKTLFNHQGAGTELNLSRARQMIHDSRRSFLAIMVSDGKILNEKEVAGFIRDNFTPPHGFIHIQVGGTGKLAADLASSGYRVHLLQKFTQLQDLVIGEVRERYA